MNDGTKDSPLMVNSRVDPGRTRRLRGGEPGFGPVLYWMRRDQRVRDNWALLYAQDLALALGRPLAVVFCLAPEFMGGAGRHDRFLLGGLRTVARDLARQRIAFFLLQGDPVREIPALIDRCGVGCLVTDFDPLRGSRLLERGVCDRIGAPVVQVDAHNVVPVWIASSKQEYAARTLRPKLHRLLPRFLTELPAMKTHPHRWPDGAGLSDGVNVDKFLEASSTGCSVDDWCEPGERPARRALGSFLSERLISYATERNDPTKAGQSDLSPYLHFGQLSAQRAAFEAAQSAAVQGREAFLEELVVRRELSDNYCHYNDDYDCYDGLPDWGRRTLEAHLDDPREHLYNIDEFEAAATHEPLWNAAQTELVVRGKLHGYMRMYWAKKILEWTSDPMAAFGIAVTLNDRYSLDGRDANGYVGCAWAIGGLHDRPWTERPVFGRIRYMNLAGCRRKFNVDRYIDRVQHLSREAKT